MLGQRQHQAGICKQCKARNPISATTCWRCHSTFEPEQMKKCAFCGEVVPGETVVCPWCGRRQSSATTAANAAKAHGNQGWSAPPPESQRQHGSPPHQGVNTVREQLYWPPASYDTGLIVWGCLTGLTLITLPIALFLFGEARNRKRIAIERRQRAIERTRSILMSGADYVGGHPLIPSAGPVVLGLTATQLTIYSIDQEHAIRPMTSIALEDIVQSGMGRPKTAREVYDDDYGRTIDVYEQSPFLRVVFNLRGDTYRASFESFEKESPPHMWYNQITTLKYQLKS